MVVSFIDLLLIVIAFFGVYYVFRGVRAAALMTGAICFAFVSVLLVVGITLRCRAGGNAEPLRQQARKAAGQGRWGEAEALISRLTDPTPEDWLLRAVVATSLNQPDVASRYLARVSKDGPLAAQVALVTSRAELLRCAHELPGAGDAAARVRRRPGTRVVFGRTRPVLGHPGGSISPIPQR